MDRERKPTRNIELTTNLLPREQQIYRLIVEDAMSGDVIIKELGITRNTYKRYMAKIYDKLGCCTTLEMAVWHYTREKR